MTTATYTQGLQAMYPSLQQIPGQIPVQQYGPPQYAPQFTPQFTPQYVQQYTPQYMPQQWAQQQFATPVQQQFAPQFGIAGPQFAQQATAASLYGQKIHRQQIAAELFRLAQQVQYSSQFVGPQPGKPSRLGIAVELHKLAQQVEQSIQAQQFARQTTPYGAQMQVPAWA